MASTAKCAQCGGPNDNIGRWSCCTACHAKFVTPSRPPQNQPRNQKGFLDEALDAVVENLVDRPIRAVAARMKERKELKGLERKVKKKQLENQLKELDK